MVGLTAGKAIALATGKPFIAINHLEAHALTARLTDDVAFPYLLLLVSGGHTQLLAVRGVGDYLKLGGTIDDAVGEAFDKIAKMLALPYPGGPSVEREAAKGDSERFDFPRPMQGRPNPDFSLSGLKTAVRLVAERIAPLSDNDVADLCASFQAAIVDVMVDRTRAGLRACREAGITPSSLVVAGGVAANQAIRSGLSRLATEAGLPMVAPPLFTTPPFWISSLLLVASSPTDRLPVTFQVEAWPKMSRPVTRTVPTPVAWAASSPALFSPSVAFCWVFTTPPSWMVKVPAPLSPILS